MKITLPGSKETLNVGKILCIGRNYAKHAAEMKSDVPDQPMVFLKPSTAIIRSGGVVVLPQQSQDVHHEVELVAVIGEGGRNIPRDEALHHVAAYAVGLDMTARDIQSVAKANRHPWSVAKGFDTFAPLGPLTPADQIGDPQDLSISVEVSGETRQSGETKDMIFPVAELIHYTSTIFTLEPGDLIYTGTPDGVGPVEDGDVIEARLTGCSPLLVRVARQAD
ncbi:isomerase/hydrolase [Longibacter salinarum]|uniref:Isomerase/hydrolase n=1 Tax=Longibacter salinarum TaxID=1850348 RepID=A0A2A8D2D6_9BACT|nr:fumarylacetoacetate hydrolase family protein [Longibacter salinarum]PEN14977.1 isomerase/hydrolase [Longibacter salinarum]